MIRFVTPPVSLVLWNADSCSFFVSHIDWHLQARVQYFPRSDMCTKFSLSGLTVMAENVPGIAKSHYPAATYKHYICHAKIRHRNQAGLKDACI